MPADRIAAIFALVALSLSGCYSGRLPAGAATVSGNAAPDIRFVELATGNTKKLSDFRGKVVVLEFWATWCPPCLGAMAKMQTYRAKHPEWGTQVELITLSVDDTRANVENHLARRGWDQTHNAWIGETPESAHAFDVAGIPHAVVLDQGGQVIAAGHPQGLDVPALIDRLIARGS